MLLGLVIAVVLVFLIGPASGVAAAPPPVSPSLPIGAPTQGTVSLDQPAYTAHENQGELTITIERTGDLTLPEHVGYGVKRRTAGRDRLPRRSPTHT